MRVVLLHSDWIEYQAKKKALKNAEETDGNLKRIEEALVALITVEKGDDRRVADRAIEDILDVKERVKAPKVVVYPWAHLSKDLAPPKVALEILKYMEDKISGLGIEVHRAPFGWYKVFRIAVKGHPLAELSREFKVEREKIVKKAGEKRFLILAPDGREIDVNEADIGEFNEDFQNLVRKEALKEHSKGGESKVLDYLLRFGFEWEPMSDYGHMRLGPYATLIFDLIAEYSRMVAKRVGVPVYEVRGTAFFDLNMKPVKEHADLYGDRLYLVETDKGDFVLRYAACHQQFAMIKDWLISYKNLPFGALEIADSYRYEQSGETELSFRLRRFWMPDMHIFVRDEEDAKAWLLRVHKVIMDEMEGKLKRNYELLVNVVSPEQYKRYKGFLFDLAKNLGKPILVAVYPPTGLNYYWTINIEYIIRDHMDRPREIGTVQIDVGNAERFQIKYVDRDNREKYPVILHTAIIGSIERYIYAHFDTAVKKKKPMLPLWLSPIQVRVIPVSSSFMDYVEKLSQKLEDVGVRVDIDDTERTLQRKILDAEKEWIPYIIVVGEREVSTGELTVRVRESGKQEKLTLENFINRLDRELRDYPRKPITVSKYVSKRPKFIKLE